MRLTLDTLTETSPALEYNAWLEAAVGWQGIQRLWRRGLSGVFGTRPVACAWSLGWAVLAMQGADRPRPPEVTLQGIVADFGTYVAQQVEAG